MDDNEKYMFRFVIKNSNCISDPAYEYVGFDADEQLLLIIIIGYKQQFIKFVHKLKQN